MEREQLKEQLMENFNKNFMDKKEQYLEMVSDYYITKGIYETLLEIEKEVREKVLEENAFYPSERMIKELEAENERLTIDNDYFMSEEDLDKYLDLCFIEYKKLGVENKKGKNYIIYAEEKEKMKRTENNLIDFIIGIVPLELQKLFNKYKFHWKYREQLLNLALELSRIEKTEGN